MFYLLLFCAASFSAHASHMSKSEAMKIEQQSQAREKRRVARSHRQKTIDDSLNIKMFLAILHGDIANLRDLLSANIIPNVNGMCDSTTPLILASGRNNLAIALLLLEHGADPNKRDPDGSTSLQRAASVNNPQMFRLLLSHGAQATQEILDRSLVAAAFNQALEMVKILDELGANINAQPAVNLVSFRYTPPCHLTPLMAALYDSSSDSPASSAIANYLISRGADVNLKDEDKRTALHYAARGLNYRMVNQLIDHGAQVDDKDIFGLTPLMMAAQSLLYLDFKFRGEEESEKYKKIAQAEETIETLIALGADYSITNGKDKNKTIFDYASNYLGIVERAVQAGLGIRMRNLKATEAQLEEAEYAPGIIQMITEYSGARSQKRKREPEHTESKENISREDVSEENQPEKRQRTIASELLNDIQEAGVMPEDLDKQLETNPDLLKIQDSEGLTPLMVAILRNRKSLFDVLLQHVMRQSSPQEYIAMKNARGQTALDLAQSRNTGMYYAKELLKAGAK